MGLPGFPGRAESAWLCGSGVSKLSWEFERCPFGAPWNPVGSSADLSVTAIWAGESRGVAAFGQPTQSRVSDITRWADYSYRTPAAL